jgi:hypothetical protein
LGIYPKKCKSIYKRDTCIPMFAAALFIISNCGNIRCPTIDECIKKIIQIIYIHTHIYGIFPILKNGIMSFSGKWRSSC